MEETTPRIRNKHATEQRAATSETTPLLQNEVAILTTGGSEASSLEGAALHHRTSALETFIHLLKGYIGAGMLSLPWAFSNLGIFGGVCGVCTLCWWTSYNCYTVVSIKRYMEKVQGGGTQHVLSSHLSDLDERNSETSSNITYPDVGTFHVLIRCSFVDENRSTRSPHLTFLHSFAQVSGLTELLFNPTCLPVSLCNSSRYVPFTLAFAAKTSKLSCNTLVCMSRTFQSCLWRCLLFCCFLSFLLLNSWHPSWPLEWLF